MSNGASAFQPSDVADPVDYEDFVYEHQPEFQSDPFRRLLQFPPDDVSVLKVARPCRTLQPVMPNALAMEVAHIRDCVKTYLSDFIIFKRNFIECGYNFSGYATPEQIGGAVEFEADKPETKACDIESTSVRDLYTHQPDITLPTVFRSSFQSTEELRDDLTVSGVQFARQPNIFSLYPDSSSRHIFERRPYFEPPLEYTGHRVLVKCVNLKSDLDVEPLFATMALYDLKERKKVSENFYFDLNTPEQKVLLSRFLSTTQDLSSLARSCIFGVSHASSDLYIVIRLEKVLQASSFADCADIYSREDVDKTRERIKHTVASNCERLGRYRMPLGWAAVNLLRAIQNKPPETVTLPSHGSFDHRTSGVVEDSSPDFAAIFETVSVRLTSFFRQEEEKLSDEDMFKILTELKQRGNAGGKLKLKTFPCSLQLELSSCPPELPNCVTPELYRLHPFADDYAVPVKELLEFPSKPIYQTHSLYRNLLYVYPKTLNLSNRNGRNIVVKVELLANETAATETGSSLPLIFGKSSSSELVAEANCSVTYHTKSPAFYDEIKMALPAPLSEQHHLLFTFSHVSCKQNKKSITSLTSNSSANSQGLESPLGYAWLPLYHDGRLSEGDFHLPVCVDHPPSGYSLVPLSAVVSAVPSGTAQAATTSGPNAGSSSTSSSLLQNIRWVDNKKPLFSVSLRPVSTIYPQDDAILSFLVTTGSSQPAVTEPQLVNCVLSLSKADPLRLIQFMPVILTRLLKLITNPPLHRGQILNIGPTCLRSICELAVTLSTVLPSLNDHLDRNKTILQLVNYFPVSNNTSLAKQPSSQSTLRRPSYLNSGGGSETDLADREVSSISSRVLQQQQQAVSAGARRHVHQELVYLWMVCDKATRPYTLSGAWLLFEIILKDLVECLAGDQRLDLPRKMRCSPDFLEDLTTLVNGLIQDIIHQISAEPEVIRRLNVYLAFFLQDLFSILDRGFVFQLIRAYVQTLTTRLQSAELSHADATALLSLRLDAFRIWASHEHFVQLNLPVTSVLPAAPSPSPSTDSSLCSTALGNLSSTGPPALSYDYRRYHFLIGLIFSDLALTLEVGDGRLQIKSAMLIRTLFSSHDFDGRYNVDKECRSRIAHLYLPLVSVIADAMGPALFCKSQQARPLLDGDRSGISNTDEFDAKMKEMRFSPDATRHLIFCIIWVLRNSQSTDLVKYFSEQGPVRINHVLALLKLCLNTFEHKLFTDDMTDDVSSGNVDDMSWGTMPSTMTQSSLGSFVKHWSPMRRKTTSFDSSQIPSDGTAASVKRKGPSIGQGSVHSPSQRGVTAYAIDTHLSTEVAMVVSDTLEIIIQVVDATPAFRGVLPSLLHVTSHAINLNQSTPAACRLLCIIRMLVVKYPELFFEQETEQTGDLCLRILRLCGCQTKAIRLHATATVYQLMRVAFQRNCGLPRVKMQLTTGLSALAGQVSSAAANLDNLSVSLRTLLAYADSDDEMATCSFPEQVHNLVVNLHSILCDTLKLTAAGEDFETVLDLMYRIAKGYRNSPDLRLIWLQNMAAKHSSLSNHAEAAQCLMHAAALVSEYLNLIEDRLYLPRGAAAFEKIAPNVVEDESAISDDLVSPQEDGVCTAKYFSESGLCGLMEHAVNTLIMGNNFEIAYELYAILSKVYEHYRDYKKLAHIHNRMSDCCNQITKLENRRLFATYFRVGFYGNLFGELDQEEFVYREPAITKLAEIAQRLQALHESRFGRGFVEIIKDSNTVNRSKLDSNKAYIQVTYVEPYFDAFDQLMRVTEFERNYGMRRFSFTTPFTVSGRAHGALHEQYKRRTILTVANALPYTKTRVTVIGKQEIVLSPIEVAIEDVQRKTAQLLAALNQTPIDAKMLQMILQGCISPAVNQGPVEVAHVFLVPCQQGQVPTHFHHKLRIAFKQFLRRCGEAVHRNRTLITDDQKDYQRELERLYAQIREQLHPLIVNSACLQQIPANSPAPSSGAGANYIVSAI